MAQFEVTYTSSVYGKKADDDGTRPLLKVNEGKVLLVEAPTAAEARKVFAQVKGEHPTHVREITKVAKVAQTEAA